ncbi:MAG: amidohydrolase family protein [Gemmatimonadota bacterium]
MKSTLVLLVIGLASLGSPGVPAPTYDLVISGGRVMDPGTGRNEILNVGIVGTRIAVLSKARLAGKRVIDARGMVVAPGFIDLHSHVGDDVATTSYLIRDGITTHLELEMGAYPIAPWYAKRAGRHQLNYGASVSHLYARYAAQVLDSAFLRAAGTENREAYSASHDIPQAVYARFLQNLRVGLDQGGIGIGSGTQYGPGITRQEMLDVTRAVAQSRTCLFTHIRYGSLVEPGSTLEAIQEMISDAAITGAAIHIVHLNSMAMSATPAMLGVIHGARARGLDISTEIYPWDASVDQIRSVIFEPGWEARWGVTAHDLQSTVTGRRLTREEFDALKSGTAPDGVLMHMNTEATLVAALRDSIVMVASDGVSLTSPNDHPRTAGTFARLLGKYVRDDHAISLMDAIRKVTWLPAQRLARFVPAMKRKGRIGVGADADITVFDPAVVAERARYLDAMQYSVGIPTVIVNGTVVVDAGKVVDGALPGRPITTQ